MDSMYYLYSTKMNGWLTSGGTYVDDIELAGEFGHADSITRVRNHYDKHAKQFMLIPVSTGIMNLRIYA